MLVMMNIAYKTIWTIVTIVCLSLLCIGGDLTDSSKSFLFCLGVISCLNISLIDFYTSIGRKAGNERKPNNLLFLSIFLPLIILLAWLTFFTDFSRKTYVVIAVVFFGGLSVLFIVGTVLLNRKKRNN